jgi:hypothetical protein
MARSPKIAAPFAIWIGIFLFAALMGSAAHAANAIKGINPNGTLDKPTISKAYFEGEFWTVINALEDFRKSGMKGPREDSVYTFKYLSVVYAADPSTRKKAESYMYQLIRMMPTIDLIDLYISDNIESIFNKVKNDYEKLAKVRAEDAQTLNADAAGTVTHAVPETAVASAPHSSATAATGKADATQAAAPLAPEPSPKHGSKAKPSGVKPWVPWALGGVGLAAAAYLYTSLGSSGNGDNPDAPRPVQVRLVTPNQGSK